MTNDGPNPLPLLIIAVLIGLIPAAIAQQKGKNFFSWWLFGAAFFILALPLAIMLPRANAPKPVPPGAPPHPAGPPAGWYPVVAEPGQERWWDGAQWLGNSRAVGS